MKYAPTSAALATYCCSTRSSVASAAAQHSGLPPNVLPWAPRGHRLHDGFPGHDQADGHAASEALGQRHDVGRDTEVLGGEHLASPADAALHFVEDQQDAVAVAEIPQALKKAVGRYQITALALKRLDENAGHLARRHVGLEEHVFDVVQDGLALIGAGKERPVAVGVRHVRDPGHDGEEPLLLGVLAGREGEAAHASGRGTRPGSR